MARISQQDAVRDASDELRERFINLVVSEDVSHDANGKPYGEVYRCTAPDGPKLSGMVFPNGSLAIQIDMLSTKEFERVMTALWGEKDDKPTTQYFFTVGARPKPSKRQSKTQHVFSTRPQPKKPRKKT